MTIQQAQANVAAKLLERALANKPTVIQQIDIDHEGDDVFAWFWFEPAEDDCFAVRFKPPAPMDADEIRCALTQVPA